MLKPSFFSMLLVAVGSLVACQQTQPPVDSPVQDGAAVSGTAGAATQTAAQSAVAAYIQQQPNAALYQVDSARFVDVDDHWQVMVPRTDWAQRMPNAAAFEVNKRTGQVTTLLVK